MAPQLVEVGCFVGKLWVVLPPGVVCIRVRIVPMIIQKIDIFLGRSSSKNHLAIISNMSIHTANLTAESSGGNRSNKARWNGIWMGDA